MTWDMPDFIKVWRRMLSHDSTFRPKPQELIDAIHGRTAVPYRPVQMSLYADIDDKDDDELEQDGERPGEHRRLKYLKYN